MQRATLINVYFLIYLSFPWFLRRDEPWLIQKYSSSIWVHRSKTQCDIINLGHTRKSTHDVIRIWSFNFIARENVCEKSRGERCPLCKGGIENPTREEEEKKDGKTVSNTTTGLLL